MIILSDKLSKSDIAAASNKVINAVLDGEVDPIEVYVRVKAVATACKQVLDNIETEVIDESYKYAGKSFDKLGATLTRKEGSLLLDYEEDAVYADIKKQLKAREEQLKTAYQMNRKGDVYIAGDGEQVPIVPPKPTKSSLAVSFKAE